MPRGPEYVAPVVAYLCTDQADYINGQVFHVERGRINTYYFGEDYRFLHKGGDGMFTVDELIETVPGAHERHRAGRPAGQDERGGEGQRGEEGQGLSRDAVAARKGGSERFTLHLPGDEEAERLHRRGARQALARGRGRTRKAASPGYARGDGVGLAPAAGQACGAYVKTLGGTREASVAGTRLVTTAVNAALANGISAHADETDDSHRASITHPGASVVPAALAMAERNRHGGTALLRAVVLGYDVGTRLTMSLDLLTFYQRGHHPPSFGGLFGAAAAAAALARLDAQHVRHALAYTAQQAAGLSSLFRDPEHIEKAFDMGGMPAHNGTQAALLAAHGFTGIADAFSGDRNFYAAFSPGANPDLLVHGLGKSYEVMNTSIKKWPVGGPILGPLDALETIRTSAGFAADDVAKLVVRIPDDRAAIVNDRAMPDINLQHMIAVMLLDGAVSFKASHDFPAHARPASREAEKAHRAGRRSDGHRRRQPLV